MNYSLKEGIVDFCVGFAEGGAETALPILGTVLALKHAAKGNKVCAAISAVYAVLGTARIIVQNTNGSVQAKMERDSQAIKRWLKIKAE